MTTSQEEKPPIAAPVNHLVGQRLIFNGNIKPIKKFVKHKTLPCPDCGGPTRREAYFDYQELYLYGVCKKDDSHSMSEYPWPAEDHVKLSRNDVQRLGFKVV
jgi:hypothetical protein